MENQISASALSRSVRTALLRLMWCLRMYRDVGGVFRVCVGVEESARSSPLMWGVFDEPLTDHDLLVLSRAFDFSDGLREHCVPAAWEALDSTLDSGVRELVSHPPRTEAELAAAIAGLGHAVARRAVDGALDRLQSRWL